MTEHYGLIVQKEFFAEMSESFLAMEIPLALQPG